MKMLPYENSALAHMQRQREQIEELANPSWLRAFQPPETVADMMQEQGRSIVDAMRPHITPAITESFATSLAAAGAMTPATTAAAGLLEDITRPAANAVANTFSEIVRDNGLTSSIASSLAAHIEAIRPDFSSVFGGLNNVLSAQASATLGSFLQNDFPQWVADGGVTSVAQSLAEEMRHDLDESNIEDLASDELERVVAELVEEIEEVATPSEVATIETDDSVDGKVRRLSKQDAALLISFLALLVSALHLIHSLQPTEVIIKELPDSITPSPEPAPGDTSPVPPSPTQEPSESLDS